MKPSTAEELWGPDPCPELLQLFIYRPSSLMSTAVL